MRLAEPLPQALCRAVDFPKSGEPSTPTGWARLGWLRMFSEEMPGPACICARSLSSPAWRAAWRGRRSLPEGGARRCGRCGGGRIGQLGAEVEPPHQAQIEHQQARPFAVVDGNDLLAWVGWVSKTPQGVWTTLARDRSVAKAGRSLNWVSPFRSWPTTMLKGELDW